MQLTRHARHGLPHLFAALSLTACGSQPVKAPPPERSVTRTEVVQADRLHFTPMPSDVTTAPAMPGYPPGILLLNGDLERRIAELEAWGADLVARIRAAACLQGTLPDTPESEACLAALRKVVHP